MSTPPEKTRRVLLIGGPMDGKWHTHHGPARYVRILKPIEIRVPRVSGDVTDMAVPVPEYENYMLEHVALYGEGIWVGLHKDTMYDLDEAIMGPPEPHIRMILKAILQRDVATSLGL